LTKKQGTLTGPKRFKNVKEAFKLRPLVTVRDSTIVVVDDVMTSGATLSELCKMLQKSGAKAVHGSIVARGTGNYRTTLEN
jgi:predicted amidophosphoribosyltransferase